MRSAVALLAAATVAAAWLTPEADHEETPPPPPALASAVRCGGCHEYHYATWRRGPHAGAAVRETFRAAYVLAVADLGEERASTTCLACHAPAAAAARDVRLETPEGREGITCDVCHSIRGVGRIGAIAPFDLAVGRTKFGPYGDGASVDHDVAKSDVIGSSRLCGGCHQADIASAFVAYNTLAEYDRSRWASTRCVDCHMGARPGAIAAGGAWRPARRDHQMVATTRAWWSRGLRLEVDVDRRAPADRLIVRLTNVAAGHAAPTGHPDERLEVRIVARDGEGRVLVDESHFLGLVLTDSAGRAPVPFWRAAAQRLDSRLRTEETREYVWSAPPDRIATAEARIYHWPIDPALADVYHVAVDPEEVVGALWGPPDVGLRDRL